MTAPVRFRSEAEADVVQAKEWYDTQRPGLGEEFVQALERAVGLVSDLPGAFPEMASGLHRALLGRFPYALYYRYEEGKVDVIACLHTRSSPRRWRRRE